MFAWFIFVNERQVRFSVMAGSFPLVVGVRILNKNALLFLLPNILKSYRYLRDLESRVMLMSPFFLK